jgi:hypothetical protein
MREMMIQSLEGSIFSSGCRSLFSILDGATVPDLPAALASFEAEHFCLLRGVLPPDLAQVAPYLVSLRQGSPFTRWLLAKGWGRHWGIYGGSGGKMIELRKHFRHLFHVSDDAGKSYYFRFYDPYVIRNYLPKCTLKEATEFFGPVQWYLTEDGTPGIARKFFLIDNALRDDRMAIAQPHKNVEEASWKYGPNR